MENLYKTTTAREPLLCAMVRNKLGPDFWSNFYRIDMSRFSTHTESHFRDAVKKLGLQTTLKGRQPALRSPWRSCERIC